MKRYRVRCREVSEVLHEVEVPDDFVPPGPAELDDWANVLGDQNSVPVETLDVQVDSVLAAAEVVPN